jgi:hypothetical protein
MLYLYWRQEVLNKDYNGQLIDHPAIKTYLLSAVKNPLKKSVAEALFTIVYAGGPRIFQKALIESRKKILNIQDEEKVVKPIEKIPRPKKEHSYEENTSVKPTFLHVAKRLVKIVQSIYKNEKEKKRFIKQK